jgi:predicted small lipoprotein YifL
LYGAARIGDFVVTRDLGRTSGGWTVIVLAVAALSLGACGRKGPLDLPPTANAPIANAAPASTDTDAEAKPGLFNAAPDTGPVAPKGAKKPFILDPLLGN